MTTQKLLLFRKWDISEIEIQDVGLKTAISLKETILPMSFGRSALKRFNKADVNIVERLVNKMMHFGKKYAKKSVISVRREEKIDIPTIIDDFKWQKQWQKYLKW